ncbi:family 43 glycosylhydrolase [Opitutus terrae]|uniref:Glycoside hydrolase family 43 n=1 Tax=Opitutus terrae (strain DSM 11246 / JCM 15787 / PB90-1) TaxID=452637 RepID=B1ZQY2_OPITP|nr:family 43 glycosylhydrolase [Opitutus terrae]ACB73649.1 glycoside hydrolase family 43 [Opitutus terrae PB90-1]
MRPHVLLRSALLSLTIVSSFSSPSSAADAAPAQPARWCNPLPLPNYPVSRMARDVVAGEPAEFGGLWLSEHKQQYRELADPTALWFEGKWYLYPSCDMAWVSADEGRTWQHSPLNIRDVGYAPTVVHHAGRFLLLASGSELYAAPTPLGPFASLGALQMPDIAGMPNQTDPMLFSDDDGRLYYYWGCTPNSGIWGVELDAAQPTRVIGEPRELIPFQPDTFPWQRLGNHNQNPQLGWMEGGWMLKRNGRYYLTYSAGGTQYHTYAMGCAVSETPLGKFVPQRRNPIFRTPEGLVTGTAHGCIVAGPRDQLWVFYTVFAGVVHGFERRLGMDLAAIDEHGELFVPAATSIPQPLPGATPSSAWLPLNDGEPTFGSSSAPNLPGRFAADHNLLTWWQPAADDAHPSLMTQFSAPAMIRATRIAWRDVGLDTVRGVKPGPVRYRVEAETAPGQWTSIIDRSESEEDLLIDYRECTPVLARRARLVILGQPAGISPAVADFTLFGTAAAD